MVSKILAAAAPPLPASASGESVLEGGLSSQYSLVHNSISFTRHQFVSSKLRKWGQQTWARRMWRDPGDRAPIRSRSYEDNFEKFNIQTRPASNV